MIKNNLINYLEKIEADQNNKLEIISRITNCFNDKSISLNISHLRINYIPEDIFDLLPHLKEFDCSYNNIKTLYIPKSINLLTLDCSNNALNTLHVYNQSLLRFDCSRNKLKNIEQIFEFTKLINLNLSNNLFTKLNLPKSKNFQLLNCSNNPIIGTLNLIMYENLLHINIGRNPDLYISNYNQKFKLPNIINFFKSMLNDNNHLTKFEYLKNNFINKNLSDWLIKIIKSTLFDAQLTSNKASEEVLSILKFAIENKDFLEKVDATIIAYNGTCEDGAVKQLNELSLIREIYESNCNDLFTMLPIFKKSFAFKEINSKVSELIKLVDPVETSLYLQIKICELLKLKLTGNAMTYNPTHYASIETLEKHKVIENIIMKTNSEEFTQYLTTQNIWIDKIKSKFKEEFEKLIPIIDSDNDQSDASYLNEYENAKNKYLIDEGKLIYDCTLKIIN